MSDFYSAWLERSKANEAKVADSAAGCAKAKISNGCARRRITRQP